MSRSTSTRTYGKTIKKKKAERLFAELPQSPVRPNRGKKHEQDTTVEQLTKKVSSIQIDENEQPKKATDRGRKVKTVVKEEKPLILVAVDVDVDVDELQQPVAEVIMPEIEIKKPKSKKKPKTPEKTPETTPETTSEKTLEKTAKKTSAKVEVVEKSAEQEETTALRILSWDDVCPPKDKIEKIAEASYAEVYRVTNERGTSIIKVIRLISPIKAQTKAQVKSGLVDEEPHSEEDVKGELQISEWLADIPGFVIYKERYIVQGKTTKGLLETHQSFQKKMKKQDPDRAQFYPSPSRYLEDTRFLVVELGDAGTALEDWKLMDENQLWDIFFLEAIALARAEDLAMFEHRDLHEGNLCIKQTRPPKKRDARADSFFGYSGLDITILDYGLSRAEDLSVDDAKPMAFDLEKDLSLFTSTHAPQCKVYRQMRSFLLRADRKCLPPKAHDTSYAKGIDGPLSWDAYAPYTNVLWLAYLYEFMTTHFAGDKKELARFKKETKELWTYLNPEAKDDLPGFGCAADIVMFAVEAGWISQEQLIGAEESMLEREDSIIISREEAEADATKTRIVSAQK